MLKPQVRLEVQELPPRDCCPVDGQSLGDVRDFLRADHSLIACVFAFLGGLVRGPGTHFRDGEVTSW